MIFVEWREVGIVLGLLSMIALAAVVCFFARRSKLLIKIMVAIVATMIGVAASGALLMVTLFISVDWNHHSLPRFSPDGRVAARINYWGGFGNTGGSYVVLHSAHGFLEKRVFDSVEDVPVENLIWKSDRELWIYYSPDFGYSRCSSSSSVSVRCIGLAGR